MRENGRRSARPATAPPARPPACASSAASRGTVIGSVAQRAGPRTSRAGALAVREATADGRGARGHRPRRAGPGQLRVREGLRAVPAAAAGLPAAAVRQLRPCSPAERGPGGAATAPGRQALAGLAAIRPRLARRSLLDVYLTSRFLCQHAIRSLESDAADPAGQRLEPRGCLQFRSLGLAEPYPYHPLRWGIGVARWSASGHVRIVARPVF